MLIVFIVYFFMNLSQSCTVVDWIYEGETYSFSPLSIITQYRISNGKYIYIGFCKIPTNCASVNALLCIGDPFSTPVSLLDSWSSPFVTSGGDLSYDTVECTDSSSPFVQVVLHPDCNYYSDIPYLVSYEACKYTFQIRAPFGYPCSSPTPSPTPSTPFSTTYYGYIAAGIVGCLLLLSLIRYFCRISNRQNNYENITNTTTTSKKSTPQNQPQPSNTVPIIPPTSTYPNQYVPSQPTQGTSIKSSDYITDDQYRQTFNTNDPQQFTTNPQNYTSTNPENYASTNPQPGYYYYNSENNT